MISNCYQVNFTFTD